MHRYREFGLVSEEDEVLRRAFRDGFKRAGLSFAQFLDALAWYRDHARSGSDEARLAEAFSEFAASRGWPSHQRDGALEIYRAIRDQGPATVTDAAPRAEDDRATVARSEDMLRSDPGRYWNDHELQDAVFEARERLAHPATQQDATPPNEPNVDRRQIEEIESLLHDQSGAGQRRYWTDAALRAQYAQALARVHGEARGGGGPDELPSAVPPAAAAPHEEVVPVSP
jgi:hypothetical protein